MGARTWSWHSSGKKTGHLFPSELRASWTSSSVNPKSRNDCTDIGGVENRVKKMGDHFFSSVIESEGYTESSSSRPPCVQNQLFSSTELIVSPAKMSVSKAWKSIFSLIRRIILFLLDAWWNRLTLVLYSREPSISFLMDYARRYRISSGTQLTVENGVQTI